MWTIIAIVSVLILIAAILVMVFEKKPAETNTLHFQLRFIVLPLAVCIISMIVLIATVGDYPDKVPFRFGTDGEITKKMAIGSFLLLMIGAQVGIALLNIILNFVLVKMSAWFTKNSPMTFNASIMQFIVTNIFLIPQIALSYILINASYYCTNGSILMPPVQFILYLIILSFLALIVLFIRAYQQSKKVMFKEEKKEQNNG
jgi:hypothetical protein